MKKSRFTESQIIKTLKENQQGRSVGELSRELGIDKSTFYYWRKKYGGMNRQDYGGGPTVPGHTHKQHDDMIECLKSHTESYYMYRQDGGELSVSYRECFRETGGNEEYCLCKTENYGCEELFNNCIENGVCEDLETLDSSFLENEKVMCIYDKLNATCGNLFNQTIGQFQEDKTLHLKWEVVPKEQLYREYANAETTPLDKATNTITIKIRDTYIRDHNQIEVAKTLLHESIHANIEAYLAHEHDLLNEDRQNTNRILQLYNYYKNEGNAAHHIFMIENYVETIASSLWQFNDYEEEVDNYMYFAWEGLSQYTDILTQEKEEEYRTLSEQINQNSLLCE